MSPFGTPVLHAVEVAYNDGDWPTEETLIWEREPGARLVAPGALPDLLASDPMPHADLTALVRACRWTSRSPFVDPDETGPVNRLPIMAPFHGAVQTEDYQLYPLLKAMRMPRVSLLIGDDVGLGKTVETGLIISELLLRRRIRRVLILTPASLRVQWREEMQNKFALPFDIVDRDSTIKLRRQLGLDANPWRSHSRIIASYHYLKQPDVLTEFMAASQQTDGSGAHLPWDLLVVDEAHNLTPVPFGDESDLCKMLRQVAPLFEHRIFASATPHNGHTRSFTGLLEMLDPVRFTQTDELKPAERERVRDVLVRRLKREINERSNPKRFCDRLPPQALLLEMSPLELGVVEAFSRLREEIRKQIKSATRQRRTAGHFAIEILKKRLLSCPATFADSWRRCLVGMAENEAEDAVVIAAGKAVADDSADDRELESRAHAAASTVGSWLKPLASHLQDQIRDLNHALEALGLPTELSKSDRLPKADARLDALLDLISKNLRSGKTWRDDERLVIFTEYMTTLNYLLARLRATWPDEQDRFLCLYGGMDDAEREGVKRLFNDPASRVRILVATDAASEGLNLQETARYLLHYDVPWVPSRLEQRNGRLDRHGQARDVETWHFVAKNDDDLAFLDMLVHKVDTIREDLGATGDVFDEVTYRRLIEGAPLKDLRADLEVRIEAARKRIDVPRDDQATPGEPVRGDTEGNLAAISAELDLSPATLHETLDSAMALGFGRPRVAPPDKDKLCNIVHPHPPTWTDVIDDAVRLPTESGTPGPIPKLAFDPEAFVVRLNGRPVFRPRQDALLLHLSHPLFQKGLSLLTRLRFPGNGDRQASRWTVRRAALPSDVKALVSISVEEMAINGLRESFHHWIRTFRIPVTAKGLGHPWPHEPASTLQWDYAPIDPAAADAARDIWSDIEHEIRTFLQHAAARLTKALTAQVTDERKRAVEQETERFQSRQGELSVLVAGNTMKKLEREIAELRHTRQQGLLFDEQQRLDELDRSIEQREEELRRRKDRYETLRVELAKERHRILNELIPLRYQMEGSAQLMPVAVEIVLPEGRS